MIILILLLLETDAAAQSHPTLLLLEKFGVPILTAIIAGVAGYLGGKRGKRADAQKTESEIISEWQEKYFGLLDKLEIIRKSVTGLESENDSWRLKFRRCIASKDGSRELLKDFVNLSSEAQNRLKELGDKTPLLKQIETLRWKASKQIANDETK